MFSQARKLSFLSLAATTIIGISATLAAQAADTPAPTSAATQNDPAQIDRDGKHICGYELMTESERAGHRSMLHATKALEDRDVIRAELCKRMHKLAEEKGVKLQE